MSVTKLSTLTPGQKFKFPQVIDNRTPENKKKDADYIDQQLLNLGIDTKKYGELTEDEVKAGEMWRSGLFMKPHKTVRFGEGKDNTMQCSAISLIDGKPMWTSDDFPVILVE